MTYTLVLGGTGFVGQILQKFGDEKFIFVARGVNFPQISSKVKFIACDLSHPDILIGRLSGIHVSRIVHLADASTVGIPSSERERFAVMLNVADNVLRLADEFQCAEIIYMSSGAVYKRSNSVKSEADPLVGLNLHNYASAKVMIERKFLKFADCSGIDCKIFRLFSFVGPSLPVSHFAIMNFLKYAIDFRPIEVEANGSVVRSYLFEGDLERILESVFALSGSYILNVGSPYAIRIVDLAERISQRFSVSYTAPNAETINPDENYYVPNCKRLCELTGFRDFTLLDEAIDITYDALMSNKRRKS